MQNIYIVDANGLIWGAFDSIENAENFGNTLDCAWHFLTNNQ